LTATDQRSWRFPEACLFQSEGLCTTTSTCSRRLVPGTPGRQWLPGVTLTRRERSVFFWSLWLEI